MNFKKLSSHFLLRTVTATVGFLFVIIPILNPFVTRPERTQAATQTWSSQSDWDSWSKTNTSSTLFPGSLTLDGTSNQTTLTLPNPQSHQSIAYDSSAQIAYLIGGENNVNGSDRAIVKFDAATESLSTLSEVLPTPLGNATAAWDSANKKAYIFTPGASFNNVIWEYDPTAHTVVVKSETLPRNVILTTAVFDPNKNKFYLFGGSYANGFYLNTIVEYDPSTGSVVTKSATLPISSVLSSGVSDPLNSRIYIFGGRTGFRATALNTINEYDPNTDSISQKTEVLPNNMWGSSAVWDATNSRAYIYGGVNTSYLSDIVSYNPSANSVVTLPEALPYTNAYAVAAWDSITNKGYLLGGEKL